MNPVVREWQSAHTLTPPKPILHRACAATAELTQESQSQAGGGTAKAFVAGTIASTDASSPTARTVNLKFVLRNIDNRFIIPPLFMPNYSIFIVSAAIGLAFSRRLPSILTGYELFRAELVAATTVASLRASSLTVS